MAYLLHKCGIITGSVNSFCLACDKFLEDEQEAFSHIKTSQHINRLASAPYSEQFKEQNIRKFKVGYFCEFCNILMPIAMKVNMHVAEEEHKQNRGTMLLKSFGQTIIAFNNVRIPEGAYHSFAEDMCSICDVEFDDENEHKKDTSHVLRLIQNPVKFGSNNAIYRHIDDLTIQCLTCNLLLTLNAGSKHFDDAKHLELYEKCKITANGDNDVNHELKGTHGDDKESAKPIAAANGEVSLKKTVDNSKSNNKNEKSHKEADSSKVLQSVTAYQREGINIDLETQSAYCRKCCVDVKFDHDDIEKHIETHSKIRKLNSTMRYPSYKDNSAFKLKENMDSDNDVNNNEESLKKEGKEKAKVLPNNQASNSANVNKLPEKEDNGNVSDDSSSTDTTDEFNAMSSERDECSENDASKFAKENSINFNRGMGTAFCRICRVRLPSSLKSMNEHVRGLSHTRNILRSKASSPSSIKKVKMESFIYSLRRFDSNVSCDYLINREYCIDNLSFLLIIKNNSNLRCLLCEENIAPFTWAVVEHLRHSSHKSRMNIPVVTSVKSEFIREIKPEVYHCGYCHLVVGNWSNMENHLKTSDHFDKKVEQHLIVRFFHMGGECF